MEQCDAGCGSPGRIAWTWTEDGKDKRLVMCGSRECRTKNEATFKNGRKTLPEYPKEMIDSFKSRKLEA